MMANHSGSNPSATTRGAKIGTVSDLMTRVNGKRTDFARTQCPKTLKSAIVVDVLSPLKRLLNTAKKVRACSFIYCQLSKHIVEGKALIRPYPGFFNEGIGWPSYHRVYRVLRLGLWRPSNICSADLSLSGRTRSSNWSRLRVIFDCFRIFKPAIFLQ